MRILGLHWIDLLIVLGYVVAVVLIGNRTAKKAKREDEFFLAGRKLGKWFQFFLNFGNMAGDPSTAAVTAGSVYREGVGGVWLSLVLLFITPYYWFMNPWFRRVRLTTIADLFEDRFGNRFMASLFALSSIVLAPLGLGLANIVALKTLQPVMAKPESAYTAADRQMVQSYNTFTQLRKQEGEGKLPRDQQQRYEELRGLYDRGKLRSYASYLKPLPFYISSGLLVCVFIMLGGLQASATVDAVQSILIIIISFILIPVGLNRMGGLHGLHASVPQYMFQIFGSEATSEYDWGSISAFLLLNAIGITSAPGNMNISGSARNELAARLGAVGGGYAKRLVTIAWCFCGLIAVAVFGRGVADPDETWGMLTRVLLPIGLIGVMLVGMLGGKLASLGATSVFLSALVVKNVYRPLFPGKSESHYMIVARLTVPVLIALGVIIALFLNSAIALMKIVISLAVIWGAPILMIFLWRRLTEMAVRIQVIACLLFIGIIPAVISATPALRRAPHYLLMTHGVTVPILLNATNDDVAAGLSSTPGRKILKEHYIEPVSVFFEEGVARIDPTEVNSSWEGVGRFNIEVWLVWQLGANVADWKPSQLLMTRYLVDSLLPFMLLFIISYLTSPTDPTRVARFYARMKTPVGTSPALDAHAVAQSYADPTRFNQTKLFPGSNWEFTKWNSTDTLGFLVCCVIMGLILLLFKIVLTLGT
jgi:solute:Na+ symporter, SSS family